MADIKWLEAENKELRRLYKESCSNVEKLQYENSKLKAEIEVLKERLLEAVKK